MDKYIKPSNRRIEKAYAQFTTKHVKSALKLIDICDKAQIEGEFIDDCDNKGLDECLIFLLEGQR